MNHLQHFPHSHHHLFGFGSLALVMVFILASQVTAQEMGPPANNQSGQEQRGDQGGMGQPGQQGKQPNEGNRPNNQGNRQDSNRGGEGMMEPNQPNQPDRMMNDRPGENNFSNDNFENNRPDGNKMDQNSNRMMNNNPGDQKNFGNNNFRNDNFGGQNNGKEMRGFDNNQPNSQNDSNRGMADKSNNQNQNGEMNSQDQNQQNDNQQNDQQDKQMVQNAQEQVKQVEQQLKQFDKQVQAITKQGLTLPAEVTDSLAKIKSIIAAVKSAKTADDLDAAGWDDLRDEMSTLHENQQLLQQLAQWPKILKQIDKQLATVSRDVKKNKSLAEKLQKKGINVSSLITELETSANDLKAVRDEAVSNISAGKIEDAFSILEDKFPDAQQNIVEKIQMIQIMSNVGRFSDEFKKGQKQMGKMIAQLKRQKVDTTELGQLQTTINQKGDAIAQLVKAEKLDTNAIMDALQELSDLRQEFMDKSDSLSGGSDSASGEQNNTNFSLPSLNLQQ